MKNTKILLFNSIGNPSYDEQSKSISDLLKIKNINLENVNLTHDILSIEDTKAKIVKFGDVQQYPMLDIEDIENFSVKQES
jgi:hypothetical protein